MISPMRSVMASFMSLVVAGLSGWAFANERVVFQCDLDKAIVSDGDESKLVVRFEGSQSLYALYVNTQGAQVP